MMNDSTEAKGEVSGPRDQVAYQVGDVFQINETHGRAGWIGAFVLATEIKSWGIQGFVAHVVTHETQSQAYIRLKWDEIDCIGPASLQVDRGDSERQPE